MFNNFKIKYKYINERINIDYIEIMNLLLNIKRKYIVKYKIKYNLINNNINIDYY